jgi:hypothetical protein
MKTLAAALLVSTFAATAHADALDFAPQADVRLQQLDRGQRRLAKGQALTGAAIVTFAAGMALGVAGYVEGRNGGGLGIAGLDIGSAITTLAGVGLAAPGIPLWVMGAREEQHARTALSATAGGLSLQF